MRVNQRVRKFSRQLYWWLLFLSLTACSSGGSGDPPPPNNNARLPQISLNVSTLDFGTAVTTHILTITNSGGGALNWQLGWGNNNNSSQPAWVTVVNPSSGQLTDGQSIDVTVTVDRSSLQPGSYSETMSVQAPGLSQPVALSISKQAPANQPPTTTISQPANNASFSVTDTISFSGSATDPEDGTLSGSALVWSSQRDGPLGTGASISVSLTPGAHQITLTATDSGSAIGSATIAVTVTQAPLVSWQFTNGPYGGVINDIVENSQGHLFASTGYAGANGTGTGRNGVFRSTDRGVSWEHASNGLSYYPVNTLAVVTGDVLLAGTYFYGGIYKSTDNGDTWNISNTGTTVAQAIVDTIVQTPNGTVYAGLRQGGVFFSTDNGDSWNSVNTGIPANTSVQGLIANSSNDVFFYGTRTVMRLTAGSDTWENVTPANTLFNSIAVDANDNVLVGSSGAIYRSDTNGDSWAPITFPAADAIYQIAGNSLGDVYAMAYRGSIYILPNGQADWTDVTSDIGRTEYHVFKVLANDVLAAGTNDGVYLSDNNAGSWTKINNGLQNAIVHALHGSASGKVIAGTSGGVFVSDNQGASWVQKNNGLPQYSGVLSIMEGQNNRLYIGLNGFDLNSGGGLYVSDDEGETWTAHQPVLPSQYPVVSMLVDGNGSLFVATGTSTPAGGGIFRYQTGALDWETVNTGLTTLNMSALAIDSTGRLFAGTTGGGLFVSSNSGDSWTSVSSLPVGVTNVPSLLVDNSDNIYISLFVSTDNGATWNSAASGIYNSPIRAFAVDQNNYVYSAASSHVYRTQNLGQSWTYMQYNLNSSLNMDALSLATDTLGYLYVGLDGGGVVRSVSPLQP